MSSIVGGQLVRPPDRCGWLAGAHGLRRAVHRRRGRPLRGSSHASGRTSTTSPCFQSRHSRDAMRCTMARDATLCPIAAHYGTPSLLAEGRVSHRVVRGRDGLKPRPVRRVSRRREPRPAGPVRSPPGHTASSPGHRLDTAHCHVACPTRDGVRPHRCPTGSQSRDREMSPAFRAALRTKRHSAADSPRHVGRAARSNSGGPENRRLEKLTKYGDDPPTLALINVKPQGEGSHKIRSVSVMTRRRPC